jgi:hypothetical protein
MKNVSELIDKRQEEVETNTQAFSIIASSKSFSFIALFGAQ